MSSSSMGLLWMAWIFLNCNTFCIIPLCFPSFVSVINSYLYVVCMWILCSMIPGFQYSIHVMAVAYWVAGFQFGFPWFSPNTPFRHAIVIAVNYGVLCMFNTKFYPVWAMMSIIRVTGSFPRMYDLNPCSILLSIPVYLVMCFGVTAIMTANIPPPVAAAILAPTGRFPDQFTKMSASTSMSMSTLGLLYFTFVAVYANELYNK